MISSVEIQMISALLINVGKRKAENIHEYI